MGDAGKLSHPQFRAPLSPRVSRVCFDGITFFVPSYPTGSPKMRQSETFARDFLKTFVLEWDKPIKTGVVLVTKGIGENLGRGDRMISLPPIVMAFLTLFFDINQTALLFTLLICMEALNPGGGGVGETSSKGT